MARRIIYWFRNDLRLFDNEALVAATEACEEIIPVYIFDPRQFETTKLGFKRTGTLRTIFLMEAVSTLRESIREKGGELLVRWGEPEKIIAQLAEQYNATDVFASKEIAPQETRIESSLSKNLKVGNVDIELYWMDTLLPAEKLPFSIARLPESFEAFWKQVSDLEMSRSLFEAPAAFSIPGEVEPGELPSLAELGISETALLEVDPSSKGGESSGLAALTELSNAIRQNHYPGECRELLIDSHLSDWLSVGCVSAQTIYHYLDLANASSPFGQKVVRSLLFRDYFNWVLLRYGPRLFKPSGITHSFQKQWLQDQTAFRTWTDGHTPDEGINQLAAQLRTTGHLSLPERETLAQYLSDTMQVNWTWGAMYFESCLLDYKVAVNWGRWNNVSGVGRP